MPDRRTALVTGANRGLGREIARQLAEDHGFLVLAGAREPTKVDLPDVIPIALDVSDQGSVDEAAARIGSDPGRLDVLVNNAGIGGPPGGAAEADLDAVKSVLETNLFGAWRVTKAVLPLLRASEDPRIVNLSSGMGQLSDMNGGSAAYRISKTSLNALTRILSAEEGQIAVNSVCPGWVRTDMGGRSARLSIEEGADTAVWLASAAAGEIPRNSFVRERQPIPW